jgi:hypothetical protein
MKENEYIDKIYLKEEEIEIIIDKIKKHSFEDYIKTPHYDLSLLSKGIDEEKLKEIYPRFEYIKLIMLRKRKNGYENYDVHYELDKGNYALFAIHFEEGKRPIMNNAFIANKIFKNFLKSVVKRYGKEMI